ncbi:MAG TPA: hypothetical protein VN950_01295 [Terriglobales bacterium]|nr:hypothetical protein [Terriglobales bacterium]
MARIGGPALTVYAQQVYIGLMLRRLNIWLDAKDLKRLADVAKKSTPGTKVSMLIRQAIAEFLDKRDVKRLPTHRERGIAND